MCLYIKKETISLKSDVKTVKPAPKFERPVPADSAATPIYKWA